MKVEDQGIVIVMTNLPDRASASRLAALLVEQRHAACVNILVECASVYRWQGNVETATEVPLLVKTSAVAYSRVEELIRANHPYELPEIVGIPVGHGLPAYLEWVAGQVGATPAQ
jgi:periplasmic divalent cation tolerance protein